jgi:hypothetical protein
MTTNYLPTNGRDLRSLETEKQDIYVLWEIMDGVDRRAWSDWILF